MQLYNFKFNRAETGQIATNFEKMESQFFSGPHLGYAPIDYGPVIYMKKKIGQLLYVTIYTSISLLTDCQKKVMGHKSKDQLLTS